MTATVPKYLLDKPTEEDALASLERIQGPERARTTWRRIRESLGFDVEGNPLEGDHLLAAAEKLLEEPGLAPVVGRTLIIRLESYRGLANDRELDSGDEEATS